MARCGSSASTMLPSSSFDHVLLPMQPNPGTETSRFRSQVRASSLFLTRTQARACDVTANVASLSAAVSGGRLVMLPSNTPVFIGVRRLHDQLLAGQLEQARQVLAYEAPDQCALDVIGEGVSARVDLISAERGLVSALRLLHRPGGRPCLRVSIHDLDRHAAFAREDEHPAAVRPVDLPGSASLFEPDQPPCSDEPVPYALVDIAILGVGQRCAREPRRSEEQ